MSEGDRIPADAVLLFCSNFSVDESLLTGESIPVRKKAQESDESIKDIGKPGGDNFPGIYSGFIGHSRPGHRLGVKATGIHTELGKIGKALQSIETETTPLQSETALLVQTLSLLGAATVHRGGHRLRPYQRNTG